VVSIEFHLLYDIVVIFAIAVVVLYLCHRLKIPSIVGFLFTGILAGPYGIALVKSVEQVESIAEIGVIFLLFSIGLEFSFKSLISIKKTILLGGSIQVGFTILFTFIIARLMNMPANQAIFLGFLVSLSSTAIVLKQLGERLEMDTPNGKTALGILIYQDIIVVAMMLFTPWLAADSVALDSLWWVLLKALVLMVAVIILSLYVLPPLLYQITRTQSRELFMLSIIVICFSIAGLTYSAGLSLALGAFLAGLIIAESEYSHQALANVIPFMDTFTSLFFVSIGMLLSVQSVWSHMGTLIIFTLAILSVKGLVAGLAAVILAYPLRIAIIVGFTLCQVGEFSFILAQTGISHGLLSPELYQGFLAASIMTMMLTPLLISIAPRVATRIADWPLPERLKSGRYSWSTAIDSDIEKENHLLIVGFGLNGRNLCQAAQYAGIPYVILELNAETVRQEQEKGQPIFFGDATHETVLRHVNIERARVAVIAISDSAALRRITYTIRKLNPLIYIIVRTRLVADMQDLHDLGADMVIPEEYETSIEIFARVLDQYMVPRDEIEECICQIRRENYEMFRNVAPLDQDMKALTRSISDLEIKSLKVDQDSPIAGRTLSEVNLRKLYGTTVLAVNQGEEYHSNPGGDYIIQAGDCLIMMGKADEIRRVSRVLGSHYMSSA
jgi:CPA2 family monovalent cation:H+ antiporter-2